MICIHNGILINGISEEGCGAVLIDGSKIKDVFSEERFNKKTFDSDTEIINAHKNYIAPGLIDTHIHGFRGHGTDVCTTEGLLQMSEDLAQYGVTAFNPTMYPDTESAMISKLQAITAAMGKEKGASIMGVHLEGPFISSEKLGVQKPETVKMPDVNLMQRLLDAAQGHIVNMTVAPELKGMREFALWCLEKGIVIQAGHTNAVYRNMIEGIQAGIFHSTHLFNAMRQMHHRDPGTVGAILIHPEMTCEIIADGIHVHRDLFKLLVRDKTASQIVLVTDALTPTEQKAEKLFANAEEVVFEGGCFHRKADGVIAGSALTMLNGVKNLVEFGLSLSDAIRCATANPARIMRYHKKGILSPGYDADVIVFDKEFNLKLTAVNGNIVKRV